MWPKAGSARNFAGGFWAVERHGEVRKVRIARRWRDA
jgi:hypothetical protein